MIEKVLDRKNLYKAYRQLVRNKGSAGVDGMKVTELFSYLENNRDRIATSILNHTYVPKPIKGGDEAGASGQAAGCSPRATERPDCWGFPPQWKGGCNKRSARCYTNLRSRITAMASAPRRTSIRR